MQERAGADRARQLMEVKNRLNGRAQLKTGEKEKEMLARMPGMEAFSDGNGGIAGLPCVSRGVCPSTR